MGMLRNDYRRALIMLRAVERGCSGHARLERRTLMGTLSFVAAAPDAARRLFAALVGQRNGNYFAAPLGELRRDSRGQYGLNASFDPRNIEGRELEDYALALVVAVGDGTCTVVLCGNVEGSENLDWARAQAAACALFGLEAGAPAQEPEPEENVEAELAEYAAGSDEQESAGDSLAESIAEQLGGTPTDFTFPAAEEAEAAEVVEEVPAGCALDIDLALPWPAGVEPLRELFQNGEPVEGPGIAGYSFVRALMPEGSGYPYVAVGVHTECGAPAFVCYALPARYTPEPPPGLEEYEWLGGSGDGWWIRCDAVEAAE